MRSIVYQRRRAREAALRALYHVELGGAGRDRAVQEAREAIDLTEFQSKYLERLVQGVWKDQERIDEHLSGLTQGYEYHRLAAVDRNVMRIAAYELFNEPAIPPAVSINEAVEIAKKYSTAESGRFVNGVLGRLLEDTPKASWDPSLAPDEIIEEHVEEEEVPIEEEIVEESSEEGKLASRFGVWKLRTELMPPES